MEWGKLWHAGDMPIEPQRFAEMTDYELLTVALQSADLAENLTAAMTLEQLVEFTRQELGLTFAKYERLMAGIELGRRISDAKQHYEIPPRLVDSATAMAFCQKHFARLITDSKQEELHVVTLSPKMHVIRSYCVSIGTLDAALIIRVKFCAQPFAMQRAHSCWYIIGPRWMQRQRMPSFKSRDTSIQQLN